MTVENLYTVIAMNLQLQPPMSLTTCQSNKPNALIMQTLSYNIILTGKLLKSSHTIELL